MEESIGREFMRKTYNEHLPVTPQKLGVPIPPLELPVPEGAETIVLPAPKDLNIASIDLRKAIEQRATMRQYGEQALTLDELSFLLWCTQGVRKVTPLPVSYRTVPSAGSRHAFETYLLVNRVAGLAPGLYRFLACDHALVKLQAGADVEEKITDACYKQGQIKSSAVTFIWVAVVERMCWRYPERGYRYLHLDAGHVCQNLYLAAEAIDSSVCAMAAFDDAQFNRVLELDGDDRFVIYLGAVGKKKA